MILVIEFYDGATKLAAMRGPASYLEALAAAREGLEAHKARHALVLDLGRGGKVVGMVHCDARP